MKRKSTCTLLVFLFVIGSFGIAMARPDFMDAFRSTYPNADPVLNNCNLCHTNVPALNPYGSDFRQGGQDFIAIEGLDSDGDGFTNIEEIDVGSFPGNPEDVPVSQMPDELSSKGSSDATTGQAASGNPQKVIGSEADKGVTPVSLENEKNSDSTRGAAGGTRATADAADSKM
jgi:hypothetical protein